MSNWVKASFLNLKVVPESPGVYAIYSGASVIYIGQSVNMRHRLSDHYREMLSESASRFDNYRLKSVKFRPCKKLEEWLSLELKLIHRLSPALNVRVFTEPIPTFCCKCGRKANIDRWGACTKCRRGYAKKHPWTYGWKGMCTDPLNIVV